MMQNKHKPASPENKVRLKTGPTTYFPTCPWTSGVTRLTGYSKSSGFTHSCVGVQTHRLASIAVRLRSSEFISISCSAFLEKFHQNSTEKARNSTNSTKFHLKILRKTRRFPLFASPLSSFQMESTFFQALASFFSS